MWRRMDLEQKGGFARWVQRSDELSGPEQPRSLYTDPVWLGGRDPSQVARLAVYEGPRALAVFLLGPGAVPLYLGEMKVGQLTFRRATLADFRVADGSDGSDGLLDGLLRAVRQDLGTDIVFHLESHRLGFASELNAVRVGTFGRRLLWLDHGRHLRRFIRLGDSFEAYSQELSAKTRHNVRRGRARLAADRGAEPRLVRVTEAGQVDGFLRQAQQVSRQTYQWEMLGLGLRNPEALGASLRFAAGQGWLRSYLLLVGDQPAAFVEGYQYAGTFQGTHSGYDPDLGRYSVGILLWVAAIEDMHKSSPPRWLDFGSGDALYKQLLSNTSVDGVKLYGWPPTSWNWLRVNTYRAVSRLNGVASRAAERLHVKAKMKHFFRARARSVDDGGQGG